MNLSTWHIVVLIMHLIQSTTAFNAKTDACTPPDGTFKGVLSPHYFACKLIDATTRLAIHDCGERGRVIYNYLDNKIRVAAASRPVDGEFTIHGVCQRDGREIMHMDLFTPTKAATVSDKMFPGFASLCNIKLAGVRHYFYAYVLTLQELGQCSLHPVSPISQ